MIDRHRTSVLVLLALASVVSGCLFDPSGLGVTGFDAEQPDGDGDLDGDTDADQVDTPDADDADADVVDADHSDADRPDADNLDADRPVDADVDVDVDVEEEIFVYRRQIGVAASTVDVPAGYSVVLSIDHWSMVSSSKSRADGRDVRLFRRSGGSWMELDRALDPLFGWNGMPTVLWFKTVAAVSASAVDEEYYLYYGMPEPEEPLEDLNRVFLFHDDFETATLDRWIQPLGDHWSTAADQAHSGVFSMKATEIDASSDRWIVARDIYADDVVLDAWWLMSSVDSMDVAQGIRASSVAPINHYESNLEGTAGWDIARVIGGYWAEITDQPSGQTPVAGEWTRVSTQITGQQMRVFINGVQVVPSSGTTDVGAELTDGSIGFRIWRIPSGQAWWLDDIRLRRYVEPEPSTIVGAEERVLWPPQ